MKSAKQKLRLECDKLWTEKCFEVWGNDCVTCGKKAVHIHHYYPKGLYSALRYEIDNGIPLCFHCHFSKTHKGDPTIHEIIKKKRGEKWYQSLKKKAYQKQKSSYLNIAYYQDIIKQLQNYV